MNEYFVLEFQVQFNIIFSIPSGFINLSLSFEVRKMSDLYSILEVPKDARPDESTHCSVIVGFIDRFLTEAPFLYILVRQTFLEKCRIAHPDREGGNVETFQAIKKAYDVLSDPIKRSKYDEDGVITNNYVYIITDNILEMCRSRYSGSEPEKQSIREAWINSRGSITKTMKCIPFMWSAVTDRSDPERIRVENIIEGI